MTMERTAETKEQFTRLWTSQINQFSLLRTSLPSVHQGDLTKAMAMLQTLVGLAANTTYKKDGTKRR